MKIPTKKLKNGFEIPVFGLGTWMMGGAKVRDENNNDESDIQAIKNAIESGMTLIDTAENYAAGWAEKIVGKAIKGYKRDTLFITSKVGNHHLRYDDVISAAKASLERLETDYLDLYLVHSPNDAVPLAETMSAMDKLVAEGLVKNIGVSNFKTSRLMEAQKLSQNKIVTNQVYYNLIQREPEEEGLLNYCQENDVILTAYRPVEKGMLLNEIPPILQEVAEKYHKTPAQVALNWLASQKNVITLTKMRDIEHLKENIHAVDWTMDASDIEKLRASYPNQIKKSENLPLL
jgi:diketogulonate reductase-like aldo/keto reductase